MGEYTGFIQSMQQATETATGADVPPIDAPATGGQYTDIIQGLAASRASAAKAAAIGAADANPDTAGKAAALAPEVGAPASTVEQDLPTYQAQAEMTKNAALIDGNPVLAGWLAANPEAARVARDDFDNLDTISKAWTALSSGWGGAFLQGQRGMLGARALAGDTSSQLTADVKGVEGEIAKQPQLDGVYGFGQKVAGFAGGLLDNFMQAFNPAAQGMVAGAGIGGMAGATAGGVGAAPGAAAGAVVGFGTGFSVGFKYDMARKAAGNSYLDMGKIVGTGGQPLDENARQMASVVVGLGTYLVAGMGEKAVTNEASALLASAVKEAVTRPTVARAFSNFGAGLAKAGLEGAALNSAMTGTEVFGEELAKQFSSGDFSTAFNDPVRRQQIVDQIVSAAVDGAMLFPIMKGPMLGGRLAFDSMRAQQANSDTAVFQGLMDGAAASKVRGRSLTAFQSFLDQQAKGSPIENLYVPGARVQELYQSMGVQPGEGDGLLGTVAPDIAHQLEQAGATGGDVVLPMSAYVAHLSGTPISEALRMDVRVSPEAWTAREAVEFEAGRAHMLGENAANLSAQMEHDAAAYAPARAVFDDMFSKLRAAGQTIEQARQNASITAARYHARAERFGGKRGTADDLYQSEGLDVTKALPQSLEGVPVDDRDMLINALRNGSKMPSDASLFGSSLLDFVKGRGGIVDDGGELRAMDLHKRKGMVIAPKDGEGGGRDMLGGRVGASEHANSADSTAHAAWEAGYFPDHAERPTTDDLFEAIRGEVNGDKRYAGGPVDEKRAGFKAAVDDLDKFLGEQGIDVKTASNAEIKRAIVEYQAHALDGQDFEQGGKAFDLKEIAARIAEQKVRAGELQGDIEAGKRVKVAGRDGSTLTVTPSTVEGYSHRVTRFEGKEPVGHIEFETATDAARHVAREEVRDGAPREFSQGALSRLIEKFKDAFGVKGKETAAEKGAGISLSRTPADEVPEDYRHVFRGEHYSFRDAEGNDAGGMAVLFSEDGKTARIEHIYGPDYDPQLGDVPAQSNTLGTAAVRSLMRQFRAEKPDVTRIEGHRVSGARYYHHADAAVELRQGERGKITLSNGRALITLFRDADLSTFVHESGHLWLDELMRDAAHPEAPVDLKLDAAAVLKWFGVNSSDEIATEHHEQFARAVERYFMEGKSPSGALEGVFRKLKAWLTGIYRHVVQLGVPMNDEIRGVMDRLIATDDEIAAARTRLGLRPVFADAASAGMTDAEFNAYTAAVERAAAADDERMLSKAMETVRAERTATWKAEAGVLREQVSREVRSRPDLGAQFFLRTGRMLNAAEGSDVRMDRVRLSRAEILDTYGKEMGEEAIRALPRGVYDNKAGVSPDDIGEMFGYRSGDELVKALMSVEAARRHAAALTGKDLDGAAYLAHLIDTETEDRMRERHGDVLSDGSIEDEAIAAVHSAARADVMATELRMMARKAGGQTPVTLDDLKSWVAREASDMQMTRAMNIGVWARAEAKAGREVERALLKGDLREAFLAKQRQLINHLFATGARNLTEEHDAAKKVFARFASRPVFDGIEQGYTDRIHELLKRFGYDTKRSDAELSKGLGTTTLEGFVNAKEGEGREFVIDPAFYDQRLSKPVDELTVAEFQGLHDAIRSLAFNGRAERQMLVEGKRVELDEIVQEAVDQIDVLPKRDIPAEVNPGTAGGVRGQLERVSATLRGVNAGLMKQENVFDWLDHWNPNGVFNRVVFRRLKEAQHRENDMSAIVSGRLLALRDLTPKGWDKSLSRRLETPELRDRRTGKPVVWRKQDIIAMALNVGNEGNFDKLVKGYGWDRLSVKTVLDREMTKADWEFVQGIWDTFEHMYPDIEAMTRRVTGIGPEKVEARPVDTPHGVFPGGYFPVVYDPLKSHAAEMRSQRAGAAMFENNYTRATTPKGHTIARVQDYSAPLRLSLDIIPWKIGQAIHDLAWREAIVDADKFLSDERVREAVNGTLGPEYTRQFRKWLQSIANERNVDEKGLAGLDWLAREMRTNMTVVGIGFRVTTMMKHGFSALSNSFGEVGAKYMLKGAREYFISPEGRARQREFALEKSGELRHRMNSIDRDVRESLRKTATGFGEGKLAGARAWGAHYGHLGVAWLDMESAVPTWFGAYRKALDESMPELDAVAAADKAVRNAHGAQGSMDLAAVQRGGEQAKLFTMFYGFFNHIYNRQMDTVRHAGEGVRALKAGDYAGAKRDFALVLARSVYYMVVPALVEGLAMHGAPDEDKGETWLGWAAKAVLGELPAGIPVVRDIAKAALEDRSYEMSPAAQAVNAVIRMGWQDIGPALGLRDQEVSDKWVKHAIETPGYILGLPTGQASGSVQYLWDLMQGTEEPEGEGPVERTFDFMHRLMTGPKPKH